jgi:two-component system chemotaxis response regulator CheB
VVANESALAPGLLPGVVNGDRLTGGDGQAALSALAVTKPQVVLLDLEMPVMDGMTAIPLIPPLRPVMQAPTVPEW